MSDPRHDRQLHYARIRARILRLVEIDPASGCWLYTGRLNNKGYGIISIRVEGYREPRKIFTHRAAWEAWRCRKMPRGRVGAHSLRCIARSCCNPGHIRATTQSHNERDKWRKAPYPRDRFRIEFPPIHTIRRKPCRTTARPRPQ